MPRSAHRMSLSTASTGCLRALVGSPYSTKYGLAASSSAPPRSASAMSAITARSPAFSATTTSGLVVLVTIARKLSSSARWGSPSPGCA